MTNNTLIISNIEKVVDEIANLRTSVVKTAAWVSSCGSWLHSL